MANPSLAEIATALRIHILEGTMNVDFLNASLHPTAHITLIVHTENLTPATSTPQNTTAIDEEPSESLHSRGSTPGLAARVAAAFQIPALDPASKVGDVIGRQRNGRNMEIRIQPNRTPRSASDVLSTQTAYPVSLASHDTRIRKRAPPRLVAPKKVPKLNQKQQDTHKGVRNDMEANEESATEDSQRGGDQVNEIAKKALVQKWGPKIPGFFRWEGLEKYAFISNLSNQEPYGAVDDILERVQDFGTHEVQKAFVQSVHSWLESGQTNRFQMQHPDHLDKVDGYDAKPFQRIWRAMRIADVTEGIGVMATLLNRKALVDTMEAYQDIVKEIQEKARDRTVKLPPRVKAANKARQIIYNKLYVDTKDRERMRRIFNYAQNSAKLFIELIQHYGSNGILAMMPAKLAESKLRGEDRIAVIIEILELIRPDLRNQNLELCSRVINLIGDGGCPGEEIIGELDEWIGGWRLRLVTNGEDET